MTAIADRVHLAAAPDIHLIVDAVAPQGSDHELIHAHDLTGHGWWGTAEQIEPDTAGGTGADCCHPGHCSWPACDKGTRVAPELPDVTPDDDCPGCGDAVFGALCAECSVAETDPDSAWDRDY